MTGSQEQRHTQPGDMLERGPAFRTEAGRTLDSAADAGRDLGVRAGLLGSPGFGGLIQGVIDVVDLDLLLLGDLQQAFPDLLAIGWRTLAGTDARQRAE